MDEQDQNMQGATDAQNPEAAQTDVGGQQTVVEPGTSDAQAAADTPVEAEQVAAPEAAEVAPISASVAIGDSPNLSALESAMREIWAPPMIHVLASSPTTLLDHMQAKIAAVTVQMTTPADGAQNPATVGGVTYAAGAGETVTVQAQHTYALLAAGWKIVVDGWEEAHGELRRLRDEMAAIPDALHHLHAPHLSDLFDRVKRWFE